MKIVIVAILIGAFYPMYGQIDTIMWEKLSPFPDSSFSACQMGYFFIDSDFYIAGGWVGSPNGIPTNGVWKYHIPSDHWSQLGNLPFGGAATSCTFVLNGKGYFLISRDSLQNGGCDTTFWEYDPSQDSWTIRAGFPDPPRQQSSNFVYGDKGYVGQTNGCGFTDTHFWKYDPIVDYWSKMATLPADVTAGSVAVAVLPAIAYLFGGEDLDGNLLNDVWRYNITLNQWDSVGQIPGLGRFFPVFWGFDSVIIGGAGLVSNNIDTTYPANDFYLYNKTTNVWAPIVFQNFPDSSYYGATFIWGERAYYFGGPTDAIQTTHNIGIWSFDASKYIHDTTTGLVDIKKEITFSVYPNPAYHEQAFSISTSESGSISFYDALGRVIDERKITHGINQIKLTTDDEVIFYRAALQYGVIENGKVVFIK